jgi:hypothetical protein
MTVALPPPEDRAFADVWTALGGELKPSLDVVVSAPIHSGRVYPAGPPAKEGLKLDTGGGELLGHHVSESGAVEGQRRVAMARTHRKPR